MIHYPGKDVKGSLVKESLKLCKSIKHRLHPKRSEEVKGRVEICEANTTRP